MPLIASSLAVLCYVRLNNDMKAEWELLPIFRSAYRRGLLKDFLFLFLSAGTSSEVSPPKFGALATQTVIRGPCCGRHNTITEEN